MTTNRTPERELQSYIDRYDPKLQKLARSLRTAIRKRLPTVNELAYDYGKSVLIAYSPTERGIESIVSIALRDDGVRMYFMHGPELPDPKGLLKGTGRAARYITVTAASDASRPDVEALIAAAIAKAKVALPVKAKRALLLRGRAARPRAGKRSHKGVSTRKKRAARK